MFKAMCDFFLLHRYERFENKKNLTKNKGKRQRYIH